MSEVLHEIGKRVEAQDSRVFDERFTLMTPRLHVGDMYCTYPGSNRWMDVRAGRVSNHPGSARLELVVVDEVGVPLGGLFREYFDSRKEVSKTRASDFM